MNKLKKIGLTALAGSMVATAATAADVTVGAGWSLSYTGVDSDEQGGTASWSMGDSVTFTTTGELDNGWTATAYYELDDDVMDDQKLTLNMGDMGTVVFGDGAAGGFGIDAVKNFVPGADTPAYTLGFTDAAYVGGAGDTGNLAYQLAVGDTGLTVGAEQEVASAGGYSRSMSVKYTNDDLGMSFGIGTSEIAPDNGSGGNTEQAIGASYTMGAFKIGASHNTTDYGSTSTNDIDNQYYGVSFAVNDDLTVSYGVLNNSIDTKADDEQITMMAASYSMGSISFSGYVAKQSSAAGTAGSDDIEKHITMSVAF
jgi:outer membrane protein OmpU